MTINSQSWAILSISGEISPQEISKKLQLQSNYFHDAEILGKESIRSTQKEEIPTIWQIHSSLPGNSPLEEHIWILLKKIAPVKSAIKELAKNCEVVIYCSVEFSGENYGGIILSPKLMLLVGSLGINLEITSWKRK